MRTYAMIIYFHMPILFIKDCQTMKWGWHGALYFRRHALEIKPTISGKRIYNGFRRTPPKSCTFLPEEL